jgi:glycoside/pentoside/hexuronide:cation symporter, GPH family
LLRLTFDGRNAQRNDQQQQMSIDSITAHESSTKKFSYSEHLSWRIKLLYGAPNVAGAALAIPIAINMPKFYTDVVGVPLGYLAIAIALARSFDALSDPAIGWLSDHTRTRLGRRRPYLIVGPPFCGLAFYLLMSPPRGMPTLSSAFWFAAFFILYFLFHTVYALPHYALGPELTLDYNERTSLFGVRESFTIIGTIIAASAPGFMVHGLGWDQRRVFSVLGIVFALLLVSLYWALAWGVRERTEFATRESNPFVPGVRRALRNRPFRILLASYVVGSITGAIPATMVPFFNEYVIQPKNPELWLSIELLGYFVTGILCMPLWVSAARRFGKRPAWLASFVMGTTGGAAMFFLGKGDTMGLLILICWAGASFGAGLFLGPAMQADVIDYDELHTGKRREAQYTAFWSILPKFVAIPSAALPFAVLASIGYVPNAVQTPEVLLAIRAIFALAPAFCAVLSFVIAWRYPISEEVHRAIREGIELHGEGRATIDPMTGETVLPTDGRRVDDETGWFLDYFSSGELRRYLAQGPAAPLRDVRLAAAASIAVTIGTGFVALSEMRSIASTPGALASIAVVTSGFALAIFVFHLLRLGAARRLATGSIDPEMIRAHLGEMPATTASVAAAR